MSTQAKLRDIIEAIGFQMDETYQYLNRETGEIVMVTNEELEAAETGDVADYPDWQREMIELAEQIVANEGDKFIELPSEFEIHEYRIMERFCLSADDPEISDELYYAIKGRGTFRRFKDRIHRYELADAWYEYRDQAVKKIAVAWCEDNDISYI